MGYQVTDWRPGDSAPVMLGKLLQKFGGTNVNGLENELLQRILMQVSAAESGSGGGGPLNWVDSDDEVDAVIKATGGTVEIGRFRGTSALLELCRPNDAGLTAIRSGTDNSDGAFLALFGDNGSIPGAASIATKGTADFTFYNAPIGSGLASSRWTLSSTGIVTQTGHLRLPAGSLGTPALQGVSDSDSGFYWPAGDTLAAVLGGSEKLRLTSSALHFYKSTDGVPTNYTRAAIQFQSTVNSQAQFAAESGGTGDSDVSILLTPKGTGALIFGPPPDSTATGGNARGARAIDLSYNRTAASQVASGAAAVVAGGARNTASGTSAVIFGGSDNVSSNIASSVLGGTNNTASGFKATCVGGGNNTASNTYSRASGFQALADKYGQSALASGFFSAQGDSQISDLVARIITTDATAAVEMFLDGSSARCTIASGKSFRYCISIVGKKVSDGTDASYEFKGIIRNIGGTTTLNQYAKTVEYESDANWDADVVADDTNDSLKLQVTGVAATTIHWVARISLTEVA